LCAFCRVAPLRQRAGVVGYRPKVREKRASATHPIDRRRENTSWHALCKIVTHKPLSDYVGFRVRRRGQGIP
jgi:hypothetical protein